VLQGLFLHNVVGFVEILNLHLELLAVMDEIFDTFGMNLLNLSKLLLVNGLLDGFFLLLPQVLEGFDVSAPEISRDLLLERLLHLFILHLLQVVKQLMGPLKEHPVGVEYFGFCTS